MEKRCRHLVLYDGECSFCAQNVRFLARHDRLYRFCFAPLDGVTARSLPPYLIQQQPLAPHGTLVVIKNYRTATPQAVTMGRALKMLLRQLGGGWRFIGYLLWLVPPVLLNGIYNCIAANRQWLGAGDGVCQKLPAAIRERLLD